MLTAVLLAAAVASPAPEAPPSLSVRVAAVMEIPVHEAKLGDVLDARITVTGPPGCAIEKVQPRSEDPAVAFLGGDWSPPQDAGGERRFTWTGKVAAYAIGDVKVPPVAVAVTVEGRRLEARTETWNLTVRGTLPDAASPAGKAPEIADVKPPEALPPDWGPLRKAATGLAALLLAATAAWWAWRRYAARLAAVPAPEDPFRRMPPHVWVYEELGRLLERRLAESGEVGRFFEEIARILKLYLSGRYRVDLMERTTDEVSPALEDAGAGPAIHDVTALLERCDVVKFARVRPSPDECRRAVEDVYRIVDATKPAEPERGAA